MKKKWSIDWDHEAVGWYTDQEDETKVIWRFCYLGRDYRMAYDKQTKQVSGR